MRLTDATGDGTQAGAEIWRSPNDEGSAVTLLRKAVDLGVQLIDTADAYALGANEELIATALHPYDGVAVATKVGLVRPSPKEWVLLGHPAYLAQQVELSLRRLRVERLDLVQMHRIDPNYPLEDQLGALAELRAEGKVRHIGLSEVTVEELRTASEITDIASVQNLYNLTARDHDPVIDYAAGKGIAFLPFFPLATGDLARDGSSLRQMSAELGITASQLALAWLLHRAPNVVPIPGTTSVDHLTENLLAANVQLDAAQFKKLDEESRRP